VTAKNVPCDYCHTSHTVWICDRCGSPNQALQGRLSYQLQITLNDRTNGRTLVLDYCSPCARFVLGALARAADAAPRAVSGDSVEDFLK
jgi:hypothetical protein